MCQVLYRRRRPRRSAACCASTAARPRMPTTITGALRRLGACLTDDAARSAVVVVGAIL